ncbi:MAG: thiolase family protein [Oscillospiraceae bacterium]|jgi:acetyl-CoA C-acetyltransferase
MLNGEVLIAAGARTPIGDFQGSLADISPIELGKTALKGALEKSGIKAELVEEVIAGNCYQASSPGNVARHIALGSGCSVSSVAMTVNQQCPSSMRAVEIISHEILLGRIEIGAVVGTESMTNAPYLLMKGRGGYRMGNSEIVDSLMYNGLLCGICNCHIGVTAENIVQLYNISREEQDEIAFISHTRAAEAVRAGKFNEEMIPVEIKTKKGPKAFAKDEHVRENISREELAKLRPVFKKDGTVTAGNSSGICDGAAALILLGKDKAGELGIRPLARVVSTASASVDPTVMGLGVTPAVMRALKFSGLTKEDIGYWEINEAFAAQFLGVKRELNLSLEIVNANGSGISLGHPVGCTGARIIVTLIYEMRRRGVRYGCAALCAGGGPAAAIIIEGLY